MPMFYTIIPTVPPSFAVQVDAAQMAAPACSELHARLERHFMTRTVLVSWDYAGRFLMHGHLQSEAMVTDDGLVWRAFELPGEPELPF